MRNAQVSLEFMLVMLALFAFLAVWLPGVLRTRSSVGVLLERSEMALLADRIAGAANSVCLMGPGNEKSIQVFSPSRARVSSNGTHVTVGNFSRRVYCKTNSELVLDGTSFVSMRNKNGVVLMAQMA
ncbi:MAG: hypothetical protein J7L23_01845 [Candidatus Diapherotrites archaeon]|nr:hypothetical protein [Candidatus Diapherotrites archaeon]